MGIGCATCNPNALDVKARNGPCFATRVAFSAKRRPRPSSKIAVYGAFIGNLLVAATKLGAALITGSAAMLSEAIHSVVDTGNEILLLYGIRRASSRADKEHPLGYGRELYFWSFIVAVQVFALGAGVSVYQGVARIRHPEPIAHVGVNYVVLALSFLFEGASWWVGLRVFRRREDAPEASLLALLERSKDPPAFIVLLEDSAALGGLIIAFLGLLGATSLRLPVLDGVASVLIGALLAVAAILLARKTKGLLIGEAAEESVVHAIVQRATTVPGIVAARSILSVHLAPDQVVVALSLEFADELRAPEIEDCVVTLERLVRETFPAVVSVFVKPQSLAPA